MEFTPEQTLERLAIEFREATHRAKAASVRAEECRRAHDNARSEAEKAYRAQAVAEDRLKRFAAGGFEALDDGEKNRL